MCGVKKCSGVRNIETTKFLPSIELKNRRLAITIINDFCSLSLIEDDDLRGSGGSVEVYHDREMASSN